MHRRTAPQEFVMSKYLLIASRDPFESQDVERFYKLAEALAEAKHQVTLFLVQNGVLPARKSEQSAKLERLVQRGVRVLADAFSLDERGISDDRLTPAVQRSPVGVVIDELSAGAKTLWS